MKFGRALSVLLVVFCVISCTKSTPKNDPDTFIVRLPSEPPNIDPALGIDTVSIDVMNNLGDGLVAFNQDMKPIPALAETYEISRDGTSFVFKIRKGVVWSDGVQLTANHFVESWERILNPKTAGEYAYFLYDILNAEDYNSGKIKDFSLVGVKANAPDTLEVKLKHSAVYWINMPAFVVMFPVRVDLEKKFGAKFLDPENFVGIGPYLLKAWEHDKKLLLVRNEKYWDLSNGPFIKNLVMQIIDDPSTAVSLFEKGQIDFMRKVATLQVQKYKNDPRFHTQAYLRGYHYGFNVSIKPFNDVRVRKALAHAIDRTEIVKVLQDDRLPTHSWIPKGLLGFNSEIGLGFDAVKAKKLLAEAGFPGGKGFPKFKLAYDTREDNKIVAESVLGQWKKNLSIAPEIENMEWKVYLNSLKTQAPGVFRFGWGADFPDAHNFMDLFYAKSGNNHTHWQNEKYESLVKQAAAEQDLTVRQSLYDKAQRVLLEEDAVIIPLFQDNINYLISPRVKDFYLDALSSLFVKHYKLMN